MSRGRTVHGLLGCMLLVLVVACSDQEDLGGGNGPAGDGDALAQLVDAYPEAAQFYDGRTVEFVIPSDPGGGYDTYSRLVIPYLERYTGATIVPRNRSGAGGLLAANILFNQAPKDGSTIGMLQGMGAAVAQIAGADGVKFDLQEFGWIGRVGGLPQVVEVPVDSELAGPEDLLNIPSDGRPLVLGATGPGSAAYVSLTMLEAAIGFPHRWATGFGGSGELRAAMLQGEIDMTTNAMDSAIDAIEAGDTRAVVSLGLEPDEFMPEVAVAHELEGLDDEAREILQIHGTADALGRPAVAPPGVPGERLAFLQEAMALAMEDPELQAKAKEAGRPLRFVPGEEMAQISAKVINAPQRYQDLVIQSYGG